jgi:hypothetical protein
MTSCSVANNWRENLAQALAAVHLPLSGVVHCRPRGRSIDGRMGFVNIAILGRADTPSGRLDHVGIASRVLEAAIFIRGPARA